MHISPFFHNLRSSYQAELEDMSFDSEGGLILDQRIARRRGELEFLLHMLEASPEMVAVVLHKAFRFTSVPTMEHLLSREVDQMPGWDSLAATMQIAPWADTLVAKLRQQPAGDWFLAVAAALEYMATLATPAALADDDAGEKDSPSQAKRQPLSADDVDDGDAPSRDEAAADWLAAQGFDRKE